VDGSSDASMSIARRLSGALVAVATAFVILAVSIVPFLSRAWVGFEQDRAQAAAWTGYPPAQLHRVTNSILGDLVLARGDFAVEVDGRPVLGERERSHMRDVRGVFAGFALLAVASAVLLAAAAATNRRAAARRRLWQSVRRGAGGLAVAIVALGVVALVAFDTAFEIFHELFFPAGSFDFDPRTDRLVQLFPDVFWSETSIAVGALTFIAALAVVWLAQQRMAVAQHGLVTTRLDGHGDHDDRRDREGHDDRQGRAPAAAVDVLPAARVTR
jgi:integral membrane protein (TIGR01906 family)